jgi:hypothetical protein
VAERKAPGLRASKAFPGTDEAVKIPEDTGRRALAPP